MIALDGHKLSIPEVWQIATQRVPCELAAEARPLIRRSRELVESLAAQPRAIYGINTGFGPLSGFRVSDADLAQHQVNLLHHLTVGQGALFSEAETRAIMLTRANALARGYSGIREELIELLLAALNRGVLPEIPSEGSVGASGDLVPLAHMAGLLVGSGYARFKGERLPAVEALKRAGLAPVVLQCKEGLALVNGTSVMTGLAALAAHEADRVLRWMELLTSCLFCTGVVLMVSWSMSTTTAWRKRETSCATRRPPTSSRPLFCFCTPRTDLKECGSCLSGVIAARNTFACQTPSTSSVSLAELLASRSLCSSFFLIMVTTHAIDTLVRSHTTFSMRSITWISRARPGTVQQ